MYLLIKKTKHFQDLYGFLFDIMCNIDLFNNARVSRDILLKIGILEALYLIKNTPLLAVSGGYTAPPASLRKRFFIYCFKLMAPSVCMSKRQFDIQNQYL